MEQEARAGFGQAYATCAPLEERDAELGLQVPDLAAQRRLRDVQALGGTADVSFLGHHHEIANLIEAHGLRVADSALLE